ncbi:hypothetical protein AB0N65_20290 [Paenarthrobacter sp. NPDC089322]
MSALTNISGTAHHVRRSSVISTQAAAVKQTAAALIVPGVGAAREVTRA